MFPFGSLLVVVGGKGGNPALRHECGLEEAMAQRLAAAFRDVTFSVYRCATLFDARIEGPEGHPGAGECLYRELPLATAEGHHHG